MTEEEAKTKWCPFARVIASGANAPLMSPVVGVYPHNRVQEPGDQTEATWHPAHECIASACMAWRTRLMKPEARLAMFRDERRLHPNKTEDQIWSLINSYDHPDGFCGLAGQP